MSPAVAVKGVDVALAGVLVVSVGDGALMPHLWARISRPLPTILHLLHSHILAGFARLWPDFR